MFRTALEVGFGWFGAQLVIGICFILLVGICFAIGEFSKWIIHKFKN